MKRRPECKAGDYWVSDEEPDGLLLNYAMADHWFNHVSLFKLDEAERNWGGRLEHFVRRKLPIEVLLPRPMLNDVLDLASDLERPWSFRGLYEVPTIQMLSYGVSFENEVDAVNFKLRLP